MLCVKCPIGKGEQLRFKNRRYKEIKMNMAVVWRIIALGRP